MCMCQDCVSVVFMIKFQKAVEPILPPKPKPKEEAPKEVNTHELTS